MTNTKTVSLAVAFLIMTSLVACRGNDASSAFKIGGTGTTVSAALTWDAPATRTDGTSLDPAFDLQAYRIHYGKSSGVYTHSVLVSNPGTKTITHTFPIAPGSYYFSVSDIDNYGQESNPSFETLKTF